MKEETELKIGTNMKIGIRNEREPKHRLMRRIYTLVEEHDRNVRAGI